MQWILCYVIRAANDLPHESARVHKLMRPEAQMCTGMSLTRAYFITTWASKQALVINCSGAYHHVLVTDYSGEQPGGARDAPL